MQLDLDETQALLRDSVRAFLTRESPYQRVRACEREGEADAQLWRRLISQGYLAAPFPAAAAGADGGLIAAGLLVEEAARRAAVLPVLEALVCALTLARHGEGAAAAEFVAQTVAGAALAAPAVLESGDSFEQIELQVQNGKLHGEKRHVDYAASATHHLVAVREKGGAHALCLAPVSAPEVQCKALKTFGRTPQFNVRYQGAPAQRVGGAEAAAYLVQAARALTCAQLLACMDISLEQTVAYTNVRKQFGRPLSTFQAVQHHAANMGMHAEAGRFLTYETLAALERGDATAAQVALTKASLSRAAPEVVMTGHQLHGGQGYIEENDLYFFTLRAKCRSLAWGSAEECLQIAAQNAEEPARWL